MTPSMPLISIIIPCYNYAHFLPDAVNSVLRQQESGLSVEIIVVDDGSQDNTATVARGMGANIRYIHQKNQGLSAARNAGIRAAGGEYMVFLDADDLLTPGMLASQLNNFMDHPELDISVCLSLQITQDKDNPEKHSCYLWPLRSGHLDMHLCHSVISPVHTFMLRAKAVQTTGFFNTDLRACEDHDYWLRCAALGKRMGTNLDGLVIYRLHGSSMISQQAQQLAHSSALRFKISALLNENPGFPRAGKFFGWLAHGAGTIRSACALSTSTPPFALKLMEEAAKAILKAATFAENANTDDNHLALAEQYFSVSFLLLAKKFTPTPSSGLQQVSSFIMHRHQHLSKLSDEALSIQQKELFQSLCCDYQHVQQTVKDRIKSN
ncbi:MULTISPECIES: glycosyltransferase family 2 protein [unclassified Desulfovibrio]|uniref:glycosyltransferase family 2 protein n=1 Tax=unclassified Desulfovibrio TaxID=2593640 RepID=UPI002FD949E9